MPNPNTLTVTVTLTLNPNLLSGPGVKMGCWLGTKKFITIIWEGKPPPQTPSL